MLSQQDKLTMQRFGWKEEPIVAIIDFQKDEVWTQKHTYPFRDLTQTALQHFTDQTVVRGIPIQRVKLTNHALSLEEAVYEDSLSEQIRPSLDQKAEKFKDPLDTLTQAFAYEMFLLGELERRAGGMMTKDQMLHEVHSQSVLLHGKEEAATKIIDKVETEQIAQLEHELGL